MKKMAKAVSTISFVVMMIAGSRLLYLFMSQDSESFSLGGNYSLGLTIGAAVITCIAGASMFYFFLRDDSDRSTERLMVSLRQATLSPRADLTKSATPEPFDITRWEQLNPWLIEGQADDRMPMLGSAGAGNGSPSVRRSTARRTHQRMYKEWSQARHDY